MLNSAAQLGHSVQGEWEERLGQRPKEFKAPILKPVLGGNSKGAQLFARTCQEALLGLLLGTTFHTRADSCAGLQLPRGQPSPPPPCGAPGGRSFYR